MTPAPISSHNSRTINSSNDTKLTMMVEIEDEDKALSNGMTKLSQSSNTFSKEEIPLAPCKDGDEISGKVRDSLVTGCSCKECMKKMWINLQLLENPLTSVSTIPTQPNNTAAASTEEQDELDNGNAIIRSHTISGHSIYDRVDHVASTTELISATLKSRQCVPNKDVQKEAGILRKHWCHLVQKIPNEDTLLLCRAIEKKPLILDPFLEMLSGSIYFTPPTGKPKDGIEDETTIHMDLRDLLECPGEQPNEFREAQILLHLVEDIEDMEVKDRILAHPLVTTFATLKYQQYRFVSIMLLVYHLLFAILFTNYAFHVFLGNPSADDPPEVTFTKCTSVVLTFMALLSSVKTITTFFASGFQFDLTTTRRLGEIFCAFIAFFMCLLPSFGYAFPFPRKSVNKDFTAFGVMTSWLVLLSYLTKFNQTAVYVQTFFQIVKNYIQFLWMVAICQLIALSASYSLIFHKTEVGFGLTGNFSRSFIRALTGRMNYDDYTGEKESLENPLSVFNYFFLFFVLSTVMMAMIIGLAQNGLQDTRSASAINVLCQVIKDIAELEWIIWRLISISPGRLSHWMANKISIKDLLICGTILELRPQDRKEVKIPVSLMKSIYSHLVDRGATCHHKSSLSVHF